MKDFNYYALPKSYSGVKQKPEQDSLSINIKVQKFWCTMADRVRNVPDYLMRSAVRFKKQALPMSHWVAWCPIRV